MIIKKRKYNITKKLHVKIADEKEINQSRNILLYQVRGKSSSIQNINDKNTTKYKKLIEAKRGMKQIKSRIRPEDFSKGHPSKDSKTGHEGSKCRHLSDPSQKTKSHFESFPVVTIAVVPTLNFNFTLLQ
ncbi:hypothetical protein AVEN_271789-1 [Araneus ventricosus]|uniref:Uncharacterized protein n=1 Tax=Araneus ventricosus TaxID=182803 RepID=A0A4Y2IG91_ARAVE|nr:hypothetical protein AVEN_271789-1 [Araneus ventricosus]